MNRTFQLTQLTKNGVKRFTHGKRDMSCLVIAEHDNKKVLQSTFNTITAAKQVGKEVNVLLAGHFEDASSVAKQVAKIDGVSKVFVANKPELKNGLPEALSPVIKNTQIHLKATHILAPSTTNGKNVLPRVAALLDVSPLSDVTKIMSEDTFMRPIYAGNALSTVKSNDPIKVITVRTTAFEKAKEQSTEAEITNLPDNLIEKPSTSAEWLSEEIQQSARPELTTARVVVSGGRGMKSGKNFELLEKLADQLGGAVGASRAAVDAGFVSNDMQVGQTGKIVAPELYIAVGISGAIQHLAGMKDSKVIVSINKDSEAPIANVADFSLAKDLFEAIPELTEAVRKAKAQ